MPNEYVFMKSEIRDEKYPRIARIQVILSRRQIRVLWLYFPRTTERAQGIAHGPKELFLSNHSQKIDIQRLMGRAAVEERCTSSQTAEHWCWNRRYNVITGKITR